MRDVIMPPFAYYGGKTSIANRIVTLSPAPLHYVEPFAGSLSVLLAKARSVHETVSDIDGDLMTFWRVLRDRPRELARVCQLTPHARAERAHAAEVLNHRDRESVPELEVARMVW